MIYLFVALNISRHDDDDNSKELTLTDWRTYLIRADEMWLVLMTKMIFYAFSVEVMMISDQVKMINERIE